MKRILLSVLGISACTTLSLFAAKSDNVCPKCKAQAQVAAYDDDDDNNEEGAAPGVVAPSTKGMTPVQLRMYHADQLEGKTPTEQRRYLNSIRNPTERNSARQEYNLRVRRGDTVGREIPA